MSLAPTLVATKMVMVTETATNSFPVVMTYTVLPREGLIIPPKAHVLVRVNNLYYLVPPGSGAIILGPTITANPLTTIVTDNPTSITVKPEFTVTETKTVKPTEYLIASGGRTIRLSENYPEIMVKISSSSPIDFIIVDEENYVKLFQGVSYNPIYVKADIVEGRLGIPPPSSPRGPYFFVFYNKHLSDARVFYEMENIWEAHELMITTSRYLRYEPNYTPSTIVMVIGLITLILAALIIFHLRRHRY